MMMSGLSVSCLCNFFTGENDVFGDDICHEPNVGQSAVDVIALTYCDLHWIQRDALIEVLEFYPEFANKFTKNLVLSYNLRDEVRTSPYTIVGFLLPPHGLRVCQSCITVLRLSCRCNLVRSASSMI